MKIFTLYILLFLSAYCEASDFRKLPVSANDSLMAIITDSDSSVVIVGYEGGAISKGVIVRCDIFGDTIWSKKFEDSLSVTFLGVTMSFDSSRLVVVGRLQDATGHKSGLILELDRYGNLQWQKKYRHSINDYEFSDLTFLSSSTFAIASHTGEFGSLIVCDSAGNVFRKVDGNGVSDFAAPILSTNGSVFLSITDHDPSDNISTNYGVKTDTALLVNEWSYVYSPFTNNNHSNAGKKGIALSDGGFVFTNYGSSLYSIRCSGFRIDSMGHVVWSVIGGPYFTDLTNGDFLFSNYDFMGAPCFISVDSSCLAYTNYNAAEGRFCSGLLSLNGKVIGITPNSFFGFDSVLCNMTNIGSDPDSNYCFPVDPYPFPSAGNFYLPAVNSSLSLLPGIDFYLDCTTDVVEENRYQSLKVFPNPSKGRVKVESGNVRGAAIVRLVDMTGRTLVRENITLLETEETFEYDFSAVPKGVYFMEIESGNSRRVSKLFIQ